MLQVQATVAATAEFDPATAKRKFTIMGSDYALTVFMAAVLQRAEKKRPASPLNCARRRNRITMH